jgi:hypothetical protein
MKDLKHIESPESITIAVRNGFKPEKMLKATEKMLKEHNRFLYTNWFEVIICFLNYEKIIGLIFSTLFLKNPNTSLK